MTNGHLTLLANREWARLQHAVGCSEQMLHTARALIKSLDPKPGAQFGASEARYVIPDVIVQEPRSLGGAHQSRVAAALRLNRSYADALGRGGGSNQSLARHLQEARWLLRSIEQRFATIQRVADAIVARQRGFFEYGEVAMKPLTLKLIAGKLGLHESTVCQVTNSKLHGHAARPVRFKALFFSRRLATENGGAASAAAVRAVMKGSSRPRIRARRSPARNSRVCSRSEACAWRAGPSRNTGRSCACERGCAQSRHEKSLTRCRGSSAGCLTVPLMRRGSRRVQARRVPAQRGRRVLRVAAGASTR